MKFQIPTQIPTPAALYSFCHENNTFHMKLQILIYIPASSGMLSFSGYFFHSPALLLLLQLWIMISPICRTKRLNFVIPASATYSAVKTILASFHRSPLHWTSIRLIAFGM